MNRNFKGQKFHVRKVKCLVRATERKMSVWRMETSEAIGFRLPRPPWRRVKNRKQKRFWAAPVNRKWCLFVYNMTWRYQICIAKFLYSNKDDLGEEETTAYEWKRSTSAVDVRRSKTFLLKLPTLFQKPCLQGFSHWNFLREKPWGWGCWFSCCVTSTIENIVCS